MTAKQKKEIKRLLSDKDGLIKGKSLLQQESGDSDRDPPEYLHSNPATVQQREPADQHGDPLMGLTPETSDEPLCKIPIIVNGISSLAKKMSGTDKLDVLVVGDASVRGLGPLIQDNDINGQAVVRAGHTLKEGASDMTMDMKAAADNTVIITGYGVQDLDMGNIEQTKGRIDSMIKTVEAGGKRVRVGLLKIPPQIDSRRNAQAKECNNYLIHQCKSSHWTKVIDSKLCFDDISKDGMFVNKQGRFKMAEAIKNFVKTTRGRPSDRHKDVNKSQVCI